MASGQDVKDIWEWNAVVPKGYNNCVHELIGKQAKANPRATAISAWDGELTYQGLDDASNSLAEYLMDIGIGPETVVPLFFDKSKWMPVSMLAVMKTGAACVALDTAQPELRLKRVIDQVDACALLCSIGRESEARKMTSVRVLPVDDHLVVTGRDLGRPSKLCVLPAVHHSSTVYISFTSGSTGTPKGAVISHSNFCSAALHIGEYLGFGPRARVFDFAPYSFDLTWSNSLHTLCGGGCLCIPSAADCQIDLGGAINRFDANLINITPSAIRLIEPGRTSLRTVILGGEPPAPDIVAVWSRQVRLLNTYGSAECPSKCTVAELGAAERAEGITMGFGLSTNTWLTNPHNPNCLSAIGSIGELWIEGPVVGKGYHKDAEATASAFATNLPWLMRKDPAGSQPSRLYRTGDLVKYNPDGSLLFVGRKDQMVKVRGQRVELGEVEHHIRQHLNAGALNNIAVEVIRARDDPGNPVLAAFLGSLQPGLGASFQGLEGYLDTTLPAFMKPTYFIPLETIPRTMTGKLDRRHLQRLGGSMTRKELAELHPEQDSNSPSATAAEMNLSPIWARVLNVDPTSIRGDSHFFRLGGNSIDAILLVAELQKQHITLWVADIFQNPRLSDLAQIACTRGVLTDRAIAPFSLLPDGLDINDARVSAARECGVMASQVEDVFPCTPLQQGLLAVTTQRKSAYTARYIYQLSADTEPQRFQRAWWEVAHRVAILRTRIFETPGTGLAQAIIDEKLCWSWTEDNIETALRHDHRSPVSLGGRLMRFTLVRPKQSLRAMFIWTIHHSLFDAWSMDLILEEVKRAYQKLPSTSLLSLKPFVEQCLKLDPSKCKQYWAKELAGYRSTPFPVLPSPNYQPLATNHTTPARKAICWRGKDFSPSIYLRAAVAILIARAADVEDVAYGTVVSGRQSAVPGIESIAGPTIATVPLRIKLNQTDGVYGLLGQVQQQAMDMLPFEQTGLQRLRQFTNEAEEASRFQTLLVIQPAHQTQLNDPGIMELTENQPNGLDRGNSFNIYALLVECHVGRSDVAVSLNFDPKVIEPAFAERMVRQLIYILEVLVACQAGSMVADLDLVNNEDLADIWRWNATVPQALDIPMTTIISEAFERFPPSSPAVHAWNGQFNYRELRKEVRRLANRLMDKGLTPGGSVVLCFEKSKWMPVAMLAVMVAGGVGVALDISQPRERLKRVMDRVGSQFVVASQEGTNAIASSQSITLLTVPDAHNRGPEAEQSWPQRRGSDSLFVVFTSGSTGTPKGVVITHSNMASALKHHSLALALTSSSRVFDFCSHAFDAFWINCLLPLYVGGCVCIPSDDDRKQNVEGSISGLQANFSFLPPSLVKQLNPAKMTCLKDLFLVGEAAASDTLREWSRTTNVQVAYGPAECTVMSTRTRDVSAWAGKPSIGHGAGAVTWIVDPNHGQSLTPIGAVGELWLEGPLVGAGYLGDLKSTASAFVEDPAWLLNGAPSHPGRRGRLYRTGDLVKYNADGSLVFVGRKDLQVKIRGQRIELAEVEFHVLRSLQPAPGVRISAAVELVQQAGASSKSLVAFLAPSNCHGTGTEGWDAERAQRVIEGATDDIEKRLTNVLPSYMIPATYYALEHLPTTATGKLDRRRLREIGAELNADGPYPKRRGQRIIPLSRTEEVLQQVWSDVLQPTIPTVPLTEIFQRLGGDSITAMQVVARCKTRGLFIPISSILGMRTIEEIARSHDDSLAVAGDDDLDSWPLSPSQQMQLELSSEGFSKSNRTSLRRLNRPLAESFIFEALGQILSSHPMLRVRYQQRNRRWVQYIDEGAQDSSNWFSRCQIEAHAQGFLASHHRRHQPEINLLRGPAFCAQVFLCGKSKVRYLRLTAPSFILDEVSWRIIWNDFETLLRGEKITPPGAASFRIWCRESTAPGGEVPMPGNCLRESPAIQTELGNHLAPPRVAYTVLDKRLTDQLVVISRECRRLPIIDMILGAWMYSFAHAFPSIEFQHVFLTSSKRDVCHGFDFSRIVGPCIGHASLHVPIGSLNTVFEAIRAIQQLQATKNHHASPRSGQKAVELTFNYFVLPPDHKSSNVFLSVPSLDIEHLIPPAIYSGSEPDRIDCTAFIEDGSLRLSVERRNANSRSPQLPKLVDSWSQNLRAVIPQLAVHSSRLSAILPPGYLCSISDFGAHPHNMVEWVYPCTAIQRQMLTAQSIHGRDIYMAQSVFGIKGSANNDASRSRLLGAWRNVVARHDILRTVFSRTTETLTPKQLVLSISALDMKDNSCNLSSSWSFRIHQSSEALLVTLDISHALLDGMSMMRFRTDLITAYNNEPLQPAVTQFGDVVPDILYQEQHQNSIDYWCKRLGYAVIPCLLPVSTNNSIQAETARQRRCSLPIMGALQMLSRQETTTPTYLILACWASVVGSILGRGEVIFGVVTAGRHKIPPAVAGPCLNILPCPVKACSSLSIHALSRSIQETMINGIPHETCSLDLIQKAVSNGYPLFNSAVNYRKLDADLSVTPVNTRRFREAELQIASSRDLWEYDFLLSIEESNDDLLLALQWYEGRVSGPYALELLELLIKRITEITTQETA
ncbi:hypothetical protein DRE_04300 [Drechslerella stenobrocha 248]|uniref:Carrier domain-containing protein n=1 Tax=Drechslerella stenobrocha 248 TaxID=1043628 RepID=W7I1G3_9PEZI|nr:hypothetical protein DRE_04300 [Drechslerella stenobrocha 248]